MSGEKKKAQSYARRIKRTLIELEKMDKDCRIDGKIELGKSEMKIQNKTCLIIACAKLEGAIRELKKVKDL